MSHKLDEKTLLDVDGYLAEIGVTYEFISWLSDLRFFSKLHLSLIDDREMLADAIDGGYARQDENKFVHITVRGRRTCLSFYKLIGPLVGGGGAAKKIVKKIKTKKGAGK